MLSPRGNTPWGVGVAAAEETQLCVSVGDDINRAIPFGGEFIPGRPVDATLNKIMLLGAEATNSRGWNLPWDDTSEGEGAGGWADVAEETG